MSRGPWKAATKAKWAETAERDGPGPSPVKVNAIEHWKDKRVRQRARAKRRTDELLKSILYKVASQNRKDAKARHAPRYIGSPCPKHDTAEKYTVNGHCIICDRERADARRGRSGVSKPRLDRKLRTVASSRPPPIRTRLGRARSTAPAPILEGEGEIED